MRSTLVRCTLFVILVSLLLTVTTSVQAKLDPIQVDSVRWTTYIDPRFDFSISYPEDWSVSPRADLPHSFGERLILTAPASEKDQVVVPVQIEIRSYLKEKSFKKDIAE